MSIYTTMVNWGDKTIDCSPCNGVRHGLFSARDQWLWAAFYLALT